MKGKPRFFYMFDEEPMYRWLAEMQTRLIKQRCERPKGERGTPTMDASDPPAEE